MTIPRGEIVHRVGSPPTRVQFFFKGHSHPSSHRTFSATSCSFSGRGRGNKRGIGEQGMQTRRIPFRAYRSLISTPLPFEFSIYDRKETN